ncbi:MAG: sensor histidine kinase [Gaiellaceae bacterium]
MSFRARLVLAALYLSTAVVLALAIPLALTVDRRADSDYEAAVLGDAAIIAARVSDLVVAAGGPADAPPSSRLTRLVSESARLREQRVVVTDAAGRVVADSDGTARGGVFYATVDRPEFRTALFQGRIDSRRRFSDTLGEDLLLVTVPVVDRGRVVGAVRLSAGTQAVETAVRASWARLALVGAVVIGAGVLVAWLLELPLGRRIRRLADASTRLGQGELAARVPEEGPEELRVLAAAFNQMAADLEGSIEAQREFVANASHQLRTPLTGLRLRLEAIKGEGGMAGEQATKAEAELDRLSTLVDDLLALARATAFDSNAGLVDLGALAREAVGRWRGGAVAAGKRIELVARGDPQVWANREDIAHVLDNLIDNALRYSPAGSEVRVETAVRDGSARLVVADTGPGISPEDRPRVFERFYRGASGRRAGPGTGLGLAIVDEHVRRWGSETRLVDAAGTCVEAVFPRLPTER